MFQDVKLLYICGNIDRKEIEITNGDMLIFLQKLRVCCTTERQRYSKCVCVCVCELEREREREL